MLQGAVGQVQMVMRGQRRLVEKRLPDPARHQSEVEALRSLHGSGLPVPELVDVTEGAILMTHLPGIRIDQLRPREQIDALAASAVLLRRLHELAVPDGLSSAPNDEAIIAEYRASGAPPLPLAIPPAHPAVFCHGDWTGGNLLVDRSTVTGIVDWEAAHVGDPIRELARAAWGASLNDPRQFDAIVGAYGADRTQVMAWTPIHAAQLWLWFSQAGPPEYLEALTRRLASWPTSHKHR